MAVLMVQRVRSNLSIGLFVALSVSVSWAGEKHSHAAHVHGLGELEVVLDGKALSIGLNSPLHNVLGFEHKPRTDTERVKARRVNSLLKANGLFAFSPEAKCKRVGYELHSDVLNPTSDKLGHSSGEHSDVQANYTFECDFPERLKMIDVRVFRQFSGFKKIQVQAVFPSGQLGASLTPAKGILEIR